MNNATPAVTVISDLIDAIEYTRQAEKDARTADATVLACVQASDNPYFPADALAAAKEIMERAHCDLNYNYDELGMALAAARAFVATT